MHSFNNFENFLKMNKGYATISDIIDIIMGVFQNVFPFC